MGFFIFGVVGFVCFVGAVLFYCWSDEEHWTKEVSEFRQAGRDLSHLKKDNEALNKRIDFLMNERNKAYLEAKETRAELEKLQDLGSANISIWRELQIRQDAVEKQKPLFPAAIQLSFIDNKPKTVSKSKETDKRGENETPKKDRTKTQASTRKSSLGRSYSAVERENSKRVPPSRKRSQSLNL